MPKLDIVNVETILLADSMIEENFRELSGVSNMFLAPEYYSGNRAEIKYDVWSIGAILYLLITGGVDHQIENSYEESFSFREPIWRGNSKKVPVVLDFIKKMMQRNPNDRDSIDELLNHEYINQFNKGLINN